MRTPRKFSQDSVSLSNLQGLMDLEEGRETDLWAVKIRLGLT